jgi:oxygen-dependent protoporphyrinogen oxidase
MTIIIGAGISGLALAYYLQKLGKPCLILEASDRVGGYLQSVREGNYLFEMAANSILADTNIVDFLHEIGLTDEILYPNITSNKRYILKNGRYCALPSSPPSLLFNNFFSWKTKFKLLKEFRNKTLSPKNETVAEFFERHFGKEIVEYAVNPFVMGIYAGNPEKLLIAKTFPQLLEMEKNYGSVLKGLMKTKSGARKLSLNFKNGMETLPKTIAKNIAQNIPKKNTIQLHTKVLNIIPITKDNFQNNFQDDFANKNLGNHKFCIETSKGNFFCDTVVITSPSFQTQVFVNQHFTGFSDALQKLHYPPLTVVHSVFKKAAVGLKLDGFGGLHPKIENQFSAGAIWTSSVLENRCPDDEIMLTNFIGGEIAPEKAQLSDELLLQNLNKELQNLYKITEPPVLQRITRWKQAIPQYDKNMIKTDEIIETLAEKRIFVAANWNLGVSLADAIKKGKELAEKL